MGLFVAGPVKAPPARPQRALKVEPKVEPVQSFEESVTQFRDWKNKLELLLGAAGIHAGLNKPGPS